MRQKKPLRLMVLLKIPRKVNAMLRNGVNFFFLLHVPDGTSQYRGPVTFENFLDSGPEIRHL